MATTLVFGPFRLEAEAEILFHHGQPTPLGRRAVALLALLAKQAGAPVAKQALLETAWPALAVEDSNLTVQIAAIRRHLGSLAGGEAWIETLPRRGYRYIGPPVEVECHVASHHPSLPEMPSVAVLPFANLSGDPKQEYFADGVVDDIITGLARIRSLFVVARSSTFTYKGRPVDAKQVGRELGVRYVVQGSIRSAGGMLRVTGQAIDTSTGAHVWAERYDRRFADVFALQDELAMSITGAIAPSLRRAETQRVMRKRPDSLDAYDLVLRAQPDVDSGMPVRVRRALVLLERALSLDPTYALAHGNAAMCHHCLFLRSGLQEVDRLASVDYARSALVHGQDEALALTLAGFSIGMDGHDRPAAFAAFEAALTVSPSSALTYILGSVVLAWGADAERAIEWSERGMRLSPFDTWAFAAYDAQAMGHFLRGRFEEACRAAYRSVQANPAHSITYVQLAAALVRLGRLEEARAAAKRVLELHPTFRYGRQFAGVDCAPVLAMAMGPALERAGLQA